MADLAQLGSRSAATAFGVLMVASAAVGADGPAVFVVGAALAAVAVGMFFRPVATFAVLLSVLAIGLSGPSGLLAGLSGLSAAAYLVCRHSDGTPVGSVLGSRPTIVAAVGFTVVGYVATSFPLALPWLPLVAPLAVLASYVVAARPFLG